MDAADSVDQAPSRIASAIGEPARTKILYCLMDGRARTSTELAAVADVATSTASAHLDRLLKVRLVKVAAEGRYRYYSLAGPEVGRVLEALSSVAGAVTPVFIPRTPEYLRAARTCYDHIAGSLGVRLHDQLLQSGWITPSGRRGNYSITEKGRAKLDALGIEAAGAGSRQRRIAFGCLDWSERRSHIGGALGAAILALATRRKWVARELDGRGLSVTSFGRQEFRRHFGIEPAAQGM